ncbi:MAG: tetratricopeptide repeat family protein [Bacillales bacterium]|jgi:tetratricopeptide (TPR) repeat protein|nr:tetratricopeptide repeat family protein [Bacillales bacterium]
MNLSTKNFYFLLIFGLINIAVVAIMANNQNLEFNQENDRMNASVELINTNPQAAIVELEKLVKKHPDNYLLYQNIGNAYALIQQPFKSVENYEKALKINPFLINDPLFDMQYAQLALYNNDLSKAKTLVKQAISIGIPKEKKKLMEQLIITINKREGAR